MKSIVVDKDFLKKFFPADAELWDALAEMEATEFRIYEDGTIFIDDPAWNQSPWYVVEPEEVAELFDEEIQP